jgi:hypothetical protein
MSEVLSLGYTSEQVEVIGYRDAGDHTNLKAYFGVTGPEGKTPLEVGIYIMDSEDTDLEAEADAIYELENGHLFFFRPYLNVK